MTKQDVLDEKFRNMEVQNNKEHWEIKEVLDKISDKIDRMPENFVTRLEFKAVAAALWTLSVIVWLIAFFSSK